MQTRDTTEKEIVIDIKGVYKSFGSNDVLKYFIDRQINIEAFNEILPSLNEIFIKQVEGTKATTRSFQKIEA